MRALDELLEEFTDKPLYKYLTFEYTPEAEIAYMKLINLLYDVGVLTEEEEAIGRIVGKLDKISEEK